MSTKKILAIIFSVLVIGAFAFVLTWGIINWSKVKDGMAGNGLYTQDDVQSAYEDGYNTALADKEAYEKLINSYRDTITTQNDLISQYTSEAIALNRSIKDYQSQVATLQDEKGALEMQIDMLNTIISSNEAQIVELNGEIASLSNELLTLQANKDENERQIKQLTEQIANLQALNSQLQENNELNVKTINGLNAQIANLNSQITELTLQAQNNSSVVASLNAKIAELQKSVSYYEQYIAALENGEQVVATFEFDGSVYNIQIVNKNSLLSVVAPTSTAYVIFNGWTVNGEPINLETYRITENTRIVADVTYKYDVTFMVDGANHNSQILVKGSKVTPPANPSKSGYVFEGWTIDGNTIVDFTSYTVTQNVTFTAKFTKLYSVIFKFEDSTLSNQTVKSGDYATAPQTSSTAYKVFNGWKVNGVAVNVDEYRITADTVFIADIIYKYDVIFMVDSTPHSSQIVEKYGKPTEPPIPKKDNHVFVGWSLNGTDTIDVSKYMVIENVTFTAVFRLDKITVTFKNGNSVVATQEVQNGSYATLPDFDTDTFMGWTIDGTTIVNLATYKITEPTTFIAKHGTWTMLYDKMYYVTGDDSTNSVDIEVAGLKAGDKITLTAYYLEANMSLNGDYWWFNSPDGNGVYGWNYGGDGQWSRQDYNGNYDGAFGGEAELRSDKPFTSTLGMSDWYNENEFTITISCKRDGYLTIEWSDTAGFFISMMNFWHVYVLR